jgi:hypothetical protein
MPVMVRRIPARKVIDRFGVCDRTLSNWLADPKLGFPRPVVINGRRYFDEDEIVAFERRNASRAENVT